MIERTMPNYVNEWIKAQIINEVPEESLQAPSGVSHELLHHGMEIRAAFHSLLMTKY